MLLPDPNSMAEEVVNVYTTRLQYESERAVMVDLGFQLWQRGFRYEKEQTSLQRQVVDNLADNYRFIRAHFGSRWARYILWLRLQKGNEWGQEWKAYWSSKSQKCVSKAAPIQHLLSYPTYGSISVIIGTLNRVNALNRLLADLESLEDKPTEIIIVEQSQDPTDLAGFSLPIKHLHTPDERGQWKARNRGAGIATGDYLAFLDDDVRVKTDWLEHHKNALTHWRADVSTGEFYPEGAGLSKSQQIMKYASQWNANNSLMKRRVYDHIGPFDERFDGTRWGDHAFGCLAFIAGYVLVTNPHAAVVDTGAKTGGIRAGQEPSFHAYGVKSKSKVAKGVALYFSQFLDASFYKKWCDAKIPWGGNSGMTLPFRLLRYWLTIRRQNQYQSNLWHEVSDEQNSPG